MASRLQHAIEREFRLPESAVVWLLRAAVVGLLAVAWWGPAHEGSPFWMLGNLVGAAALSAYVAFTPTDRPRLLKRAEAVLHGAFVLNLMGSAFRFYERYNAYDLLLHFLVSAAVVYVVYAIAQAKGWRWLWRWSTPLQTGVFAFFAATAFGVVWELFEGLMELLPGTSPIRSFYDTVRDLAADASGALVGALVAAYGARKRAGHAGDDPEARGRSQASG